MQQPENAILFIKSEAAKEIWGPENPSIDVFSSPIGLRILAKIKAKQQSRQPKPIQNVIPVSQHYTYGLTFDIQMDDFIALAWRG